MFYIPVYQLHYPVNIVNILNFTLIVPSDYRSSILDDRSLRIERVKVHDEGTYICRAENSVGGVEVQARLTIHSHPTFIVTPQDKVVGVGRSVSLRCQVSGNPPPNVFWNKDTGQVCMERM